MPPIASGPRSATIAPIAARPLRIHPTATSDAQAITRATATTPAAAPERIGAGTRRHHRRVSSGRLGASARATMPAPRPRPATTAAPRAARAAASGATDYVSESSAASAAYEPMPANQLLHAVRAERRADT